ncbi:MAG: cell wall hydrolase [Clostridia bacterium]|nr:cell wall hydrolase [Clostridia bacterium]
MSVIAAKICLEWYTVSEDALFFYAPRYVYAAWIEENREYLFTIGGHKFFA